MPSVSYRRWRTVRAAELDELVQAHAAVGGTGPGRRYTTQQLNRAYAVLLASQFQGFCRDLHTECVNHLLGMIAPPPALQLLVWAEFTRGRQLDRGNAHSSSLGADFGRLEIAFWNEVKAFPPAAATWQDDRDNLDLLNEWRNAIVHQNFTSPKLGGKTVLQLAQVRRWRASCVRLARAMDDVLAQHLQSLTGVSPW
jgi:hypothetical protein